MTARSNAIYAAAIACILAGCSQDGTLGPPFNTASIDPAKQEQAKSTEALCLTLSSQIEALNTEGVSDKVSKAAAKKYKLKQTDLSKADELNKANTEFQAKCSSYPPRVATTAPIEPVSATPATASATPTTPGAPQKTVVAKAKPPVPSQKPVAAAMAPQETTAAAAPPATDAGGSLPTP